MNDSVVLARARSAILEAMDAQGVSRATLGDEIQRRGKFYKNGTTAAQAIGRFLAGEVDAPNWAFLEAAMAFLGLDPISAITGLWDGTERRKEAPAFTPEAIRAAIEHKTPSAFIHDGPSWARVNKLADSGEVYIQRTPDGPAIVSRIHREGDYFVVLFRALDPNGQMALKALKPMKVMEQPAKRKRERERESKKHARSRENK